MLYNVRNISPYAYRMVKFDDWFNVETSYLLYQPYNKYYYVCNCFQSNKPSCRHREMLSMFIKEKKVNTGWFYNYDTKVWERPVNDPVRVMIQKIERSRREK